MSISNLVLPDINKAWANLNVNSIASNSMIVKGDLAVDILQADDEIFILVVDDFEIDAGKELRVDTIRENTGLNSVEFPTNLKSDLIEGIAGLDVQIDQIKSDLIVEASTDDHVSVRRMVTDEPLQETSVYTAQTVSSTVETVVTNFAASSEGDKASGYLPNSNLPAGLFTIQETGIYCTNLKIDWNIGNTNDEKYYFRCENTTFSTRDGVEVELDPGVYTGGGSSPQANQSHIGFYQANDILNITHFNFGGVSTPTWDIQFQVIRIK